MRDRLAPILVLALILALAAAVLTAAADPAAASPSKVSACTGCHSGAPSGTVSATPSTATPAPGATYTVTVNIGLTASGNTGYHVVQTDVAGTATTWVTVYGGPGAQTTWTPSMTAPSTPGTYYYKVWCVKGPNNSSGMAKTATYSITVPAPAATPAITTLTPNHAQAGASVVIAGTGLGASGTVKFGTTTATTTAWSATSITATVPASLAAGATTVTVTPAGASASNSLAFTVDARPVSAPSLTSLLPNTGIAGSSFTITGANLGTSGSVTVGGLTAATSAWSATSITCTVPAASTTGAKSVVVTPTGASATNALTYTVTAGTPPPPPPPPPADTTAPVTTASDVPALPWCNYAVTVSLTAVEEPGGSGVASITYAVDGGADVPVAGDTATVPLSTSGQHTVTFFARDVAGNTETAKSVTVNIDLSKPQPQARAAKVRHKRTASLRYQIVDDTPNAGTASVKIVIRNSRGRVVKRLKLGSQPVNTALKATFTCGLRPGIYRFQVSATDAAGNPQASVATKKLRVLAH